MSSPNIKHTRKSAATEDKEKKRQSDSPAKEMMKKLAAKEKDKKETPKEKSTEKEEKNVDKQEKKQEKNADKKEEKGEKSGKTDKPEKRSDNKPKQNGNPTKAVQNGVSDVTLNANGAGEDPLNGTVSSDSEEEAMVIDDQDEVFPELTYDETSDNECFEPPTPENVPSRSFTRRSQVKSARTPETPRPASEKPAADAQPTDDNPKETSKVLKLKDDTPASDRRLRSADSPKPESAKAQDAKKDDNTDEKKDDDKKQEREKTEVKEDGDKSEKEKRDIHGEKEKGDKSEAGVRDEKQNEEQREAADAVIDITSDDEKKEKDTTEEKSEKIEMEVIVEVEGAEEGSRKTDTNYSKSRVKVSPYRRSMRLAEQAETSAQGNVSLVANYTGNNTTMEMDITESSFMSDDGNLDNSGYLRGLRTIRGRSSYKPLKEYTFKHTAANRSTRSTASTLSEQQSRPTGTVVGRKRKPEGTDKEGNVETTNEATEYTYVAQKRMRLLDRIALPFRRTATLPNMGQSRRTAEIVGINTDLPLTAPVVSSETFDPESLKGSVPPPIPAVNEPVATPLPMHSDKDSKRCVIV